MAVIVNGDGILTGISSLTTALTDITSGRGTITGVTTVGTLQLGAGVSISSPRSQQAAIFTNNTEFLTVDDAGRVGVGTITPNSDAHPENEKKINVGFITAKSIAGDIDARNVVVAGVSTFVGALNATLTGTASGNAVLTGSTNNTVTTVTGANAIQGEGNLTYDGSVLQVATDTNMEGIKIIASGDTYSDLIMSANRSGSGNHIGRILGQWNGANAASIVFNTGGDTSSKDDGEMLFATSNGGSSLSTRMTIKQDGKIGVNVTPSTGQFVVKNSDDSNVNVFEVYNDNGNMSGSFSQTSAGDGTVGVRKNDGTLTTFFRSNGISYLTGGSLLLGHTSSEHSDGYQLELSDTGSSSSISLTSIQNNSYASQLSFVKARGSSLGARTVVQDGDLLGQFAFYGADGTNRALGCTINVVVDGTPGNDDMPTQIKFATSNDGTQSVTDRLRLRSSGDVQVPNGNVVIQTSGKGVEFHNFGSGATISSNLLDDYEEGTAVPDFANADNSIITVDRYSYTKVGRLVHFEAKFTVGSNNDGSGFGFTLPFGQAGSRETVIPAISTRSGTTTTPFAFVVNANQSYCYAKALDGYGGGDVEYVDFAGDIILVSGTYEAA